MDLNRIPTDEDFARLVEQERGRFLLKSANSGRKYLIEIGKAKVACGCTDYQVRRKGTNSGCKHIHEFAWLLGWRLIRELQRKERKIEDETEPF